MRSSTAKKRKLLGVGSIRIAQTTLMKKDVSDVPSRNSVSAVARTGGMISVYVGRVLKVSTTSNFERYIDYLVIKKA